MLALFSTPSVAATLHVPLDYPSIQDAIDAAVDGDTIQVAIGTYQENINFLGKAISLVSVAGPELTIIDGGSADSVVIFNSGEGPASILDGFTITHGRSDFSTPGFGDGGGIWIDTASPTILNNIITDNEACAGFGVSLSFSSSLIQNNTITSNVQGSCGGGIGGGGISILGASAAQIIGNLISNHVVGSNGGGIALFSAGTPLIQNNIIRENSASGSIPCSQGGGIWIVNSSDASIIQNLIIDNNAGCGGGIYWAVPSGNLGPLLVNNTIANNDSPSGSGIFAGGYDENVLLINNIIVARGGQAAVYCDDFNDLNPPIFSHNDVYSPTGPAYDGICQDQTGLMGNLSADPRLTRARHIDYQLGPRSPAIDAGDNAAPALPTADLDGRRRMVNGDNHGGAIVDMGAYEFQDSRRYGR